MLLITPSALGLESHGVNFYLPLKYDKDFSHFAYVEPNAKKGGTFTISSNPFVALNIFALRGGNTPYIENLIFDTLLKRASDELNSFYCHLCESIQYSDDYKEVTFKIRDNAKWSDGSPLTVKDIKFTFEILKREANPIYQINLSKVKDIELLPDNRIKFTLYSSDSSAIINIGSTPILSRKFWRGKSLASYEGPIMGSGPYTIHEYKYQNLLTFKRNENYWAKDLPTSIGSYNFDTVVVKFFADLFTDLDAFIAGEIDYREEITAKSWKFAYKQIEDNPTFIKVMKLTKMPPNPQYFIMNFDNPLFHDYSLRKTLALCFDFDWLNKYYFYSSYKATESLYEATYFENKEIDPTSLRGENYCKKYSCEEFELAKTEADSIKQRQYIKQAKDLLLSHGYYLKDNLLYSPITNKPVIIDMIYATIAYDKLYLSWQRNLAKLGITMRLHALDVTDYNKRQDDGKYDIIGYASAPFLNTGVLEKQYFHSKSARAGSYNYSRLKDPHTDMLIEKLATSKNLKEAQVYAMNLDYHILSQYYIIPSYSNPYFRYAYLDKFFIPKQQPDYEIGIWTWSIKE
jgi:microcin C transport system substrate-binding protein